MDAVAGRGLRLVRLVLERKDEPPARPERPARRSEHLAQVAEVHQRVRRRDDVEPSGRRTQE